MHSAAATAILLRPPNCWPLLSRTSGPLSARAVLPRRERHKRPQPLSLSLSSATAKEELAFGGIANGLRSGRQWRLSLARMNYCRARKVSALCVLRGDYSDFSGNAPAREREREREICFAACPIWASDTNRSLHCIATIPNETKRSEGKQNAMAKVC